MSIRDKYSNAAPWIAFVLFCAIAGTIYWAYTYSKGSQAERENYQAERSAYAAQQQAFDECLERESIQEARECYQSARYASREQERAEQDLTAQREMADWTEGMLIISAVVGFSTVIITSLGVYWVRETLVATRKAVEAAEDGAKAAHGMNKIVQKEQRPYLFIENPSHNRTSQELHENHVVWAFTVKNYGKSPAIVEGIKTTVFQGADFERRECRPFEEDKVETIIISAESEIDQTSASLMSFPTLGAQMRMANFGLDEATIRQFRRNGAETNSRYVAGEIFIFLRVIIQYRDVAGQRYERSAAYCDRWGDRVREDGGAKLNYDREA